MANQLAILDQWSVKDLEDGSSLNVLVQSCTEMGNESLPGIMVQANGHITNFEPGRVAQWAYKAGKLGQAEYFIEESSWTYHQDQYVKIYLVTGSPLKAKVEVKTRSSKPVIREYPLPFEPEMH